MTPVGGVGTEKDNLIRDDAAIPKQNRREVFKKFPSVLKTDRNTETYGCEGYSRHKGIDTNA